MKKFKISICLICILAFSLFAFTGCNKTEDLSQDESIELLNTATDNLIANQNYDVIANGNYRNTFIEKYLLRKTGTYTNTKKYFEIIFYDSEQNYKGLKNKYSEKSYIGKGDDGKYYDFYENEENGKIEKNYNIISENEYLEILEEVPPLGNFKLKTEIQNLLANEAATITGTKNNKKTNIEYKLYESFNTDYDKSTYIITVTFALVGNNFTNISLMINIDGEKMVALNFRFEYDVEDIVLPSISGYTYEPSPNYN